MRFNPRKLYLCTVLSLVAGIVPRPGAAAEHMITRDAGRRVGAATVMVRLEYEKPHENKTSWGSGFVVGDGLIMTNAHVVSEDVPTRVHVHNEYLPESEARIIARRYDADEKGAPNSSYHDMALLAYTPPPDVRLPILPFSLGGAANQRVFAFGYPDSVRTRYDSAGYGGGVVPRTPLVITDGAINQIIAANPFLIMHSAVCKTGNSGGPLVNARGEVVGMQTWSAVPGQSNLVESFAIGSQGLVSFMRANGYRPYVAGGY